MAKGDIPLHPEKGVNPYMTACPLCGEDGQEIVMVGANDHILKCAACGQTQLGKRQSRKCQGCGAHELVHERQLEDHEKIAGSPCDKCVALQEQAKQMVEAGGVYWRCKDCGANGAVPPESEVSSEVRAHAGIQAPEACGVELSKDNCPACGSDAQEAAE